MRTERDMVSMILKNSQYQQKYWALMNRATCGILDEFRQNMLRISEKVEFFIRKTHLLLER